MIRRAEAGEFSQVEINRGLPANWLVQHFERVGAHWRVAPALVGHRVPPADLILTAAAESLRWRTDHDRHPGAQRPAAAVGAGPRF